MVDERYFTGSLGRFFGGARGVVLGIGDDAAVVTNPGERSVLCCDPVVEGVHFEGGASLGRVGRKAVNRNLADLAAMGAVPDWLLVSVVAPRGTTARRLRSLLAGVRAAARAAACTVVGGDIATGPGPLVVTVTAVGHPGGRVLVRSGARPGDRIHVTGPLGGSGSGRHLTFRPPLAEGAWLARQGAAIGAVIDVSDGLLLDLHTVLAASGGLGAELQAAAIPVSAAARRAARGNGAAALEAALRDGEDHVLLFTVRRGQQLGRNGPLTAVARRPIGTVERRPGLRLRAADGTTEALRPEGYQHALG